MIRPGETRTTNLSRAGKNGGSYVIRIIALFSCGLFFTSLVLGNEDEGIGPSIVALVASLFIMSTVIEILKGVLHE